MMRAILILYAGGVVGCFVNIGDSGVDQDAGGNRGIDAGEELDAAVEADAPLMPARCSASDGDASILDPATGHCYFWVDQPVTRLEAIAACRALDAELVTITSAAENDIVAVVAPDVAPEPDVGRSFDSWIGANDIVNENVFVWDNGEPFVFDAFRDGEPNDSSSDPDGEDCLIFEGDTNLWDDRSCKAEFGGVFRYICEREP